MEQRDHKKSVPERLVEASAHSAKRPDPTVLAARIVARKEATKSELKTETILALLHEARR